MKQTNKRSTNKKSRGNSRNTRSHRDVNTKFEGKSISPEEDVRSDVRRSVKGENDAAWYGVSGQMVNDTARVSFNNPVGYPLDLGTSEHFIDQAAGCDLAIPGIMTFDTCMGPGISLNNNSAVNLAAKNIYTFVRHVNSGARNYEPADLMMYMLAIGAAYTWYAHLVRAYGIARTYKQSNRYYPDALLLAMGFNPKDIKNDMPRFRSIINTFVRKIGSRPIPANLNFLKRQTWMYSNIFKDAESNKAQMYMFVPRGFHFYDEYNGAGRLKWVQYQWLDQESGGPEVASTHHGMSAIERICDHMANLILSSEDLGIISGDIVKAYGQNVYQLSEVTDDFCIEPIHSMEVLTQIHNINAVGDPNLASMHITQTTGTDVGAGALIWKPESYEYHLDTQTSTGRPITGKNIAFSELNHILDLPYTDPTPDDVMVATRLTARLSIDRTGSLGPDDSYRYYPIDCGTEFIAGIHIFTTTADGSGFQRGNINGTTLIGSSYNSVPDVLISTACTKFDWHPIFYLYRPDEHHPNHWNDIVTVGDLDNCTTVSPSLLKRMDNTAVLSLWDVPETAFYKG